MGMICVHKVKSCIHIANVTTASVLELILGTTAGISNAVASYLHTSHSYDHWLFISV